MGHQIGGHFGALGILANQNGDVLVVVAFRPKDGDVGDHTGERRLFPAGFLFPIAGISGQEGQAHISFRIAGVLRRDLLLAVAVDAADFAADFSLVGLAFEHGADAGENLVVEFHHGRTAAPVLGERLVVDGGGAQVAVEIVAHQAPVGTAPAVDRLLDVAHHQVGVALGHAVGKQRAEIVPLQDRRVLRLVEQDVVVAVADLLVDEGRVVVGDDAAQQVGGLPEEHHVVLLQVFLEVTVNVGVDAQQMEVVADDAGAVPDHVPDLIMGDGGFDQVGEGVAVGEARERLPERFGFGGFEIIGHPLGKNAHRAPALALEIVGRPSVLIHQRQGSGRYAAAFLFVRLDHRTELLAERPDTFLVGENVRDVAHLEQERLVEEVARHLLERGGHTPALPLLHQVEGILLEPAEQLGVLRFGDRVEHTVDDLREHGVVVELHAIGGVLPDFAGESPHHRLEELVDGAHREAAVVVQHPAQRVGRLRRPRIVALRELVERRNDARFHLLGGLVGEGDGQDVLVALRIARQQQVEVILCQPVGLAAAGGGFDDGYRRLHRRLKLQYLHTSSLSAATKGFSERRISSIRAISRRS